MGRIQIVNPAGGEVTYITSVDPGGGGGTGQGGGQSVPFSLGYLVPPPCQIRSVWQGAEGTDQEWSDRVFWDAPSNGWYAYPASAFTVPGGAIVGEPWRTHSGYISLVGPTDHATPDVYFELHTPVVSPSIAAGYFGHFSARVVATDPASPMLDPSTWNVQWSSDGTVWHDENDLDVKVHCSQNQDFVPVSYNGRLSEWQMQIDWTNPGFQIWIRVFRTDDGSTREVRLYDTYFWQTETEAGEQNVVGWNVWGVVPGDTPDATNYIGYVKRADRPTITTPFKLDARIIGPRGGPRNRYHQEYVGIAVQAVDHDGIGSLITYFSRKRDAPEVFALTMRSVTAPVQDQVNRNSGWQPKVFWYVPDWRFKAYGYAHYLPGSALTLGANITAPDTNIADFVVGPAATTAWTPAYDGTDPTALLLDTGTAGRIFSRLYCNLEFDTSGMTTTNPLTPPVVKVYAGDTVGSLVSLVTAPHAYPLRKYLNHHNSKVDPTASAGIYTPIPTNFDLIASWDFPAVACRYYLLVLQDTANTLGLGAFTAAVQCTAVKELQWFEGDQAGYAWGGVTAVDLLSSDDTAASTFTSIAGPFYPDITTPVDVKPYCIHEWLTMDAQGPSGNDQTAESYRLSMRAVARTAVCEGYGLAIDCNTVDQAEIVSWFGNPNPPSGAFSGVFANVSARQYVTNPNPDPAAAVYVRGYSPGFEYTLPATVTSADQILMYYYLGPGDVWDSSAEKTWDELVAGYAADPTGASGYYRKTFSVLGEPTSDPEWTPGITSGYKAIGRNTPTWKQEIITRTFTNGVLTNTNVVSTPRGMTVRWKLMLADGDVSTGTSVDFYNNTTTVVETNTGTDVSMLNSWAYYDTGGVGPNFVWSPPLVYTAVAPFTSAHWTMVNFTSSDTTKLQDGITTVSAGTSSSNAYLQFDAGVGNTITPARFDFVWLSPSAHQVPVTTSGGQIAYWSDNGTDWTQVTPGAGFGYASYAEVLATNKVVEHNALDPATIGAHRYFRFGAVGFVMDSTAFYADLAEVILYTGVTDPRALLYDVYSVPDLLGTTGQLTGLPPLVYSKLGTFRLSLGAVPTTGSPFFMDDSFTQTDAAYLNPLTGRHNDGFQTYFGGFVVPRDPASGAMAPHGVSVGKGIASAGSGAFVFPVWAATPTMQTTLANTDTLGLANSGSGYLYTNEGDADGSVFNLPSAVQDYHFSFYVQAAHTMTINAYSGDTIRIAGSVSIAGGYVSSATVGSFLHLVAINATEWVATQAVGTWAVETT